MSCWQQPKKSIFIIPDPLQYIPVCSWEGQGLIGEHCSVFLGSCECERCPMTDGIHVVSVCVCVTAKVLSDVRDILWEQAQERELAVDIHTQWRDILHCKSWTADSNSLTNAQLTVLFRTFKSGWTCVRTLLHFLLSQFSVSLNTSCFSRQDFEASDLKKDLITLSRIHTLTHSYTHWLTHSLVSLIHRTSWRPHRRLVTLYHY